MRAAKLSSETLITLASLFLAGGIIAAALAVSYFQLPSAWTHSTGPLSWVAEVAGGSAVPACSSSSTSGGSCSSDGAHANITFSWSYLGNHGTCTSASVTITGVGTRTGQPCTGSWSLTNIAPGTTFSYSETFATNSGGDTDTGTFTTPNCCTANNCGTGDVCTNLPGLQTVVPTGYTTNTIDGSCLPTTCPLRRPGNKYSNGLPTSNSCDYCLNQTGVQNELSGGYYLPPSGVIIDNAGYCTNTSPTTGILTGKVFKDTNGNGVLDSGEQYIENTGTSCTGGYALSLSVYSTSTAQSFSTNPTKCDPNPYYSVTVNPGSYIVTTTLPSGWKQTTPNASGTVVAGATTTLALLGAGQLPTATLTPSPSTIAKGASATLTWSSTNATSCTGSGFSTGNATSGSVSVSPSTTTNYGVTCSNSLGSSAANATVTVVDPTVSVYSDPARIVAGQTATIHWSATNVTSCTIKYETGATIVSTSTSSGSFTNQQITTGVVSHDKSYALDCVGLGGGAHAKASVILGITPGFQEF